ncbi:excinuclease ABC subunit UvrB [Patescibacteria group bacterium]|nr:MAG: excinuclease ABC subunit UvrB [Patescibacteria group bacterium]
MMKFKLHSKYKPTGDQPRAIKELTKGLKSGDHYQTLLGVTGSGKTFTIANVIEKIQKPTLIIVHNKTLAAQLYAEFKEFFPNNAVHYFVSYYDYYQPEAYVPRTDTYIEKDASINEEIDRLRNAATHSLLTRKDVLVIASVSCIYGLGEPEVYEELKVNLKKKRSYALEKVLKDLNAVQYQRNDVDFHRGTYRVRGDVLEIFPSYGELVIRISFFGEEIESIQEVDYLTGEVKNDLDEISVYPAKHFVIEDKRVKRALREIEKDLKDQVSSFKKQDKLLEAQRLNQRTKFDLEMIRETGYCTGIENYSRYFDSRDPGEPPAVLLEYFPKDFLLIIDESHMTVPQIGGMHEGDRARKQTLIDYGFRLPSALDNRPLNFREFREKIGQTIFTSATPRPFELKHSKQVVEQVVRPTGLIDPEVVVKPTKNQIDDLLSEIQKRVKKNQRILVTTLTKRLAEELTDYLSELKIKVQYLHSDIETLKRVEILHDLREGVYDVVVGINLLREGLDLPEVSLVTILDADSAGFLRSREALIQTIGRAARHIDGKVIMYADTITAAMKEAIDETNRRKKIQIAYNKKHGITPRSIEKEIKDEGLREKKIEGIDRDYKKRLDRFEGKSDIPKDEVKRLIKELEAKMDLAAKNLEFEKAAELRDEVEELKRKGIS